MVERIESYRFSKRFKKEYNSLSKEIQKVFDKKLTLFLKDTTHPSLRLKRIQGSEAPPA
jgi:mRNA-degrading endonuclease RelE of RelBE toxin-antitoxin system